MERKRIYCEIGFWDRFKKCYPATIPLPTDSSISKSEAWNNVYSMLCRSDICFDCDESIIEERINPTDGKEGDRLLQLLLKKHTGGNIRVDYKPHFVKLGNTKKEQWTAIDLCSVFMTEKANSQADDMGILNITPSNYESLKSLFIDSGISIKKGTETEDGWNFLEDKARHNCNSMIIVDNYVLGKQKHNLLKILDALLPYKLDIPFDLTLICDDEERFNEKIKKLEKTINTELIKNRRSITINFQAIPGSDTDENEKVRHEMHDRSIITNNIWISSGGGFDLFVLDKEKKVRSSKSTTISIVFPFMQNKIEWVDDAYITMLDDVLDIFVKKDVQDSNRLFDAYCYADE